MEHIKENNLINDGPKIGFLEAFYGILFSPKKTFESLREEDGFTIVVYGMLAVFLSNFGKIDPENFGFFSIIGVEFIGFITWFFMGLLVFFFSTVFKTPNSNFARLLGFTGFSSLPILLLTPIALINNINPNIYNFFQCVIGIWAFILYWISLAKSFQLETWRVLLMAIIPFLLGIFLFTFLLANILGFLFSSAFM